VLGNSVVIFFYYFVFVLQGLVVCCALVFWFGGFRFGAICFVDFVL